MKKDQNRKEGDDDDDEYDSCCVVSFDLLWLRNNVSKVVNRRDMEKEFTMTGRKWMSAIGWMIISLGSKCDFWIQPPNQKSWLDVGR